MKLVDNQVKTSSYILPKEERSHFKTPLGRLYKTDSEIEELMYVEGDATEDDVLKIAQIEKAKAIITTLPNDADNLFVVLSAKDLNINLIIISRASEEHSDFKLRQAGADNIIMPDKLGGQQMAKLVTHPDTVEFMDYVLQEKGDEVRLHEVSCKKLNLCHITKTIGDFNIRKKTSANIIGIKTSDGAYIFNPSAKLKLSCEDKIFVLATIEQVSQLKNLLYSNEQN